MGERFKQLRKKLGLSQIEFAKRLGLTRGAISNIEAGKVQPKPLLIDLICSTFRANKEWLVSSTGPMLAERSRDDQIMDFVSSAMAGERPNFKRRLLSVLSQLNENQWEMLEKYLLEMVPPLEAPTDNTEDGP